MDTDQFQIGDIQIDSIEVDHSIETVAYRFEDVSTGSVFVFSGDTTKIPELSTFARDADVLLQDACAAPMVDDPPEDDLIASRLANPTPEKRVEKLNQTHCTPTEAGQIADEAGVSHLVLTHMLPQRDCQLTHDQAADQFDGKITIAEDGLTIPV